MQNPEARNKTAQARGPGPEPGAQARGPGPGLREQDGPRGDARRLRELTSNHTAGAQDVLVPAGRSSLTDSDGTPGPGARAWGPGPGPRARGHGPVPGARAWSKNRQNLLNLIKTSRKLTKFGPIKVSQALAKCAWCGKCDFKRFFRVPRPSGA